MLRDDIPLAGLMCPPLTTLRQPAYELGRLAARFLIEWIAHPDAPTSGASFPASWWSVHRADPSPTQGRRDNVIHAPVIRPDDPGDRM
jgi:hypothetical protein